MISMLYELLYLLPISLIVLLTGESYLAFPYTGTVIIILDMFIAIAVVYMFNTRNKIKYLLPGFCIMLTIVPALLKAPGEKIEFLLGCIWIYELVIIVLVCDIIGKLASKYRWLRIVLTVGVFLYLIASFIFKYEINTFVISLCFLMMLLLLADDIQIGWVKKGDTDRKKHLVLIAPFILLTCFLVANIPTKKEPYDWKIFVNLWHKTVELAEDVAGFMPGKGEGTFSEVGFSDKAFMNEISSNSNRVIMNVTPGGGAGKMVYLAAGSFDSFDGREWSATDAETGPIRLIDLVEMQCAVRKWDRDHYSDYIKSGTVEISYIRYKPGILFAPTKTLLIGDKIDNIEYVEKQNSIALNKKTGRNITYKSKFDRLNINKDKFAELMDNTLPLSRKEWENGLLVVSKNNIAGTSYDDYLRYREDVYKYYYEDIPVSDDVKELLNSITDGSESKWDRLKKEEAWLSKLDYKWDTDSLPDDINSSEEFLDYFLLEKKEGYCVHFATAMALLARAEGLPSRITQGVYVLSGSQNDPITSRAAHVWTEVYFDNFGWVSFEPTPGYRVDNSWTVSDEYVHKEPIKINENYVESDKDINESYGEFDEESKPFPIKVILTVLGVIILFTVAFITVFYFVNKKQLDKLSMVQLAKLYCKRNILLLGYLGYKKNENETLSEYEKRLKKSYLPGEEALSFIAVYEQLLYSDHTFEEAGMSVIENAYESMINMVGSRHSVRRIIIKIRLFTGLATK